MAGPIAGTGAEDEEEAEDDAARMLLQAAARMLLQAAARRWRPLIDHAWLCMVCMAWFFGGPWRRGAMHVFACMLFAHDARCGVAAILAQGHGCVEFLGARESDVPASTLLPHGAVDERCGKVWHRRSSRITSIPNRSCSMKLLRWCSCYVCVVATHLGGSCVV